MSQLLLLVFIIMIVNTTITDSQGGDGISRDIQRQELDIERDLANIQQDQVEEQIVQSAIGNTGNYGNQQWGRR
jgi:hypothetical protein